MLIKMIVPSEKFVELNEVDVQTLFNALAVYKQCCEDFRMVSPHDRENEYFKLCEQVSQVSDKLLPFL